MSEIWNSIRSNLFSIHDISDKYRELCVLFMRIRLRKKTIPDERSRIIKLLQGKKIQKHKILFRSAMPGYGGDAKAITEEILRRRLPWELVWVVRREARNSIDEFPADVRLVGIDSDEVLAEYVSSEIWIDEVQRRLPLDKGIRKRREQFYIMMWNNVGGICKHGIERHDMTVKAYKPMKEDLTQVNFFVSNSRIDTGLYNRLFDSSKVLASGRPHNDIFFRSHENVHRKVHNKLGLVDGEKLLLYLPETRVTKNNFSIDIDSVRNALKKRFGGEWKIAAKMRAKKEAFRFYAEKSKGRIIDISTYPDIVELLVAADALISDYSSWAFDYLYTGRPSFLYTPDLEEYQKKRGFYFNLEESPFPLAKNIKNLVRNIEIYNERDFCTNVARFIREKRYYDDGHAAERVVDALAQLMARESVGLNNSTMTRLPNV